MTFQSDEYGSDTNQSLAYIDPDSPVALIQNLQYQVARQRVAMSEAGYVLAIAPDGTLWGTSDPNTVPGTQTVVPDLLATLNTSIDIPSDFGGAQTPVNTVICTGITYSEGTWWLLVSWEQYFLSFSNETTGPVAGDHLVTQRIVKVMSSTTATPSAWSDWSDYRVLQGSLNGDGYYSNYRNVAYLANFPSGILTTLDVYTMPVRFPDGSVVITVPVTLSFSSGLGTYTLGVDSDGTVSWSGTVTISTFTITAKTLNGAQYLNSATGSTLMGLPVHVSAGVLVWDDPETVNDYSTAGPSYTQVPGFYFAASPCGVAVLRAAVKTDDLTDVTLPAAVANDLGGAGVTLQIDNGTHNRKVLTSLWFGVTRTLVETVAGHTYDFADSIGCTSIDELGWSYFPTLTINENEFGISVTSPDGDGFDFYFGVGAGGTILHVKFDHNFSVSLIQMLTGTTTTHDLSPGVGTPGIAPFYNLAYNFPASGYVPISFDGDGTAPCVLGFSPTVGQGRMVLANGVIINAPGNVMGGCDNGSDGALFVCDDTNLYSCDNAGNCSSAIATGVINSGDYVQFMRRRTGTDVVLMHGQFGSVQIATVVGGVVTQGTPFSFPTDTYNKEIRDSSSDFLTTEFSAATGF